MSAKYQVIGNGDADDKHSDEDETLTTIPLNNCNTTAEINTENLNAKAAHGIDRLYGPMVSNKRVQSVPLKLPAAGFSSVDDMSAELLREDTFRRLPRTVTVRTEAADIDEMNPRHQIFDLPRDVLTAYMLIHLENDGHQSLWDQYPCLGKLGIVLGVATPFAIQYFVAVTLIVPPNLDIWDATEITDVQGVEIWYNVISLAILFIYMFRDLGGYLLVWRACAKIEEQQHVTYNPFHRSRLAEFGSTIVHVNRWDYQALDPRQVNVRKQRQRLLFIQFRVLILGVFALYFMLALYSLVQIALTEDLADKLEVTLAIFFLLEVDDWAYELFFAQNNFIQDSKFELQFELPNIDIVLRRMAAEKAAAGANAEENKSAEAEDGDEPGNDMTLNTLMTNRIGNVRKEIYNAQKTNMSELVNKSCIVLTYKNKVMRLSQTIEQYAMKNGDVIEWFVDSARKSKTAQDADAMNSSLEHESDKIYDQRTKSLWYSLWFVYGSLLLVLIFSAVYLAVTDVQDDA